MTTSTRVALTRIPDSWGWMAPDLLRRLLPFAVVVAVVEIGWRPGWLRLFYPRPAPPILFSAPAPPLLFLPPAPGQPPPPRAPRAPRRPPGRGRAAVLAPAYVLNRP